MSRNLKLSFAMIGLLLVASSSVCAGEFRPIVGLGYQGGGEKLLTVYFTDGSDEAIEANGGFFFNAGVSYDLTEQYVVQSMLGYQSDTANAENGDVAWSSFPWETSLLMRVNQFLVGGGIVFHFGPELTSSGIVSLGRDLSFDTALGTQIQAAWTSDPNNGREFQIGLHYQMIDFKYDATTFDGNTLGAFLRYQF
ncbi:MAG: hypothetical protein ACWA44_13700 [Thiotrichales bacterium]